MFKPPHGYKLLSNGNDLDPLKKHFRKLLNKRVSHTCGYGNDC